MWVDIDLSDFSALASGFIESGHQGKRRYSSEGLPFMEDMRGLAFEDDGQMIEVDPMERTVRFGRDYLGKSPLVYATARNRLFVSDELNEAYAWLARSGRQPALSEPGAAMYFAAGYVPQGMCIYDGIGVCRNASYYEWRNGKIRQVRTFSSVEPDPHAGLESVREAIDGQAIRICHGKPIVDVWCSGGIDSSSVARVFNEAGRRSRLLTLSYGTEISRTFGDGELPFAREMAAHCSTELRYVEFPAVRFLALYKIFTSGHISPAIDSCVLAKYALAARTEEVGVTGEGGDPLFGGVKNDFVLYYHEKAPSESLGLIYALSHKRFFHMLDKIMVRGKEYQQYAAEYYQGLLDSYPGDLIRKLFYMNSFEKQGGMIFPESYYPAKHFGKRIFHPLTGLDVYHAAFRLTDDKRYVYPQGKLALKAIYGDRLPLSILNRKKSGTQLPLGFYLNALPKSAYELEALRAEPIFRTEFLDDITKKRFDIKTNRLLYYAMITLNEFLQHDRRT